MIPSSLAAAGVSRPASLVIGQLTGPVDRTDHLRPGAVPGAPDALVVVGFGQPVPAAPVFEADVADGLVDTPPERLLAIPRSKVEVPIGDALNAQVRRCLHINGGRLRQRGGFAPLAKFTPSQNCLWTNSHGW